MSVMEDAVILGEFRAVNARMDQIAAEMRNSDERHESFDQERFREHGQRIDDLRGVVSEGVGALKLIKLIFGVFALAETVVHIWELARH